MVGSAVSFVGRDAELDTINTAISDAVAGRGGSWLLSGAPGIGKSRLAEEIARSATKAGFAVGWGRCWEAGGAPAFWPWTQSLRSLCRSCGAESLTATVREQLQSILPELASTPTKASDPKDRFELLEEVTSAICTLATAQPLLIILDDLHAADHSSLTLLDFAARQFYASPVVVLGTFRVQEAQQSEHATLLARIAQDAHTIPLGPLDADAVETYLAGTIKTAPNVELAQSLHKRTEGNPLFVVELVRLIANDPNTTATVLEQASLPPGLQQTLRARVGALSDSTCDVMTKAAIMGREFGAEALAKHFDVPFEQVRAAVDEGVAQELLHISGDDGYRFSHILLRDVLEDDAEPAHRRLLHRTLAESLVATEQDWFEISHHFELAGSDCLTEAVDALSRAGQSATAKLAFEDAGVVYRRGIQLLDRAAVDDKGRRIELLLGLSRAQVGIGEHDEGRDCCQKAAALARELEDATLLARAALQFGSNLVFGTVDPRLVQMLQEALDALPSEDSPLRARVQARLAAAMQPAKDPRVPIELAIEAIEMARRLEDPATVLATLSSGCSAMVDLAAPDIRLPFDREHASLAAKIGGKRNALRAQHRLIFDCFQLGDRVGADAAILSASALIREIDHRSVAWLRPAMDAMQQLWEGELQLALKSNAHATELGEQAADPNYRVIMLYQRNRILRMLGRDDDVVAGALEMQGLFQGTSAMQKYMQSIVAGGLLHAGQRETALRFVDDEAIAVAMALGERAILEPLTEIAVVTNNNVLASNIRDRLSPVSEQLMGGGVMTMTWDSPVHRTLARCCQVLGELESAIKHFESAILVARRLGGQPLALTLRTELGELLASMNRQDEARSSLAGVEEQAASLGMVKVARRAREVFDGLGGVQTQPTLNTEPLQFEPEGDVWKIQFQGREIRIKNSKGIRFIASLVEQPQHGLHVLEMAAPAARQEVDTEGGEVLDAEARDAYKERIQVLREQMDEAEGFNDPGRAAAARAEMDMLVTELSRGMGLSGRSRQFSTNAERARVNVQRRIRDAIRRIGELDQPLARHLDRCIRTGTHCSYEPE